MTNKPNHQRDRFKTIVKKNGFVWNNDRNGFAWVRDDGYVIARYEQGRTILDGSGDIASFDKGDYYGLMGWLVLNGLIPVYC